MSSPAWRHGALSTQARSTRKCERATNEAIRFPHYTMSGAFCEIAEWCIRETELLCWGDFFIFRKERFICIAVHRSFSIYRFDCSFVWRDNRRTGSPFYRALLHSLANTNIAGLLSHMSCFCISRHLHYLYITFHSSLNNFSGLLSDVNTLRTLAARYHHGLDRCVKRARRWANPT